MGAVGPAFGVAGQGQEVPGSTVSSGEASVWVGMSTRMSTTNNFTQLSIFHDPKPVAIPRAGPWGLGHETLQSGAFSEQLSREAVATVIMPKVELQRGEGRSRPVWESGNVLYTRAVELMKASI